MNEIFEVTEALSKNDSEQFINLMMKSSSHGNTTIESLEKIKSLLSESLKTVNNRITQEKNTSFLKQTSAGSSDRKILQKINDTSFLEPRGKVNVIVFNDGLSVEGKQSSTFLLWSNISHIVRVPSHASVKKEGEDILIFRLIKPVTFNNKETKHFLWTVSNTTSKADGSIESDTVVYNICQNYSKKIVNVNKSIFQTVINQKSYLRCYKGTQEGALYPLKCGLIFIKPLVFIPNEGIASVSAGRGGGSGNTKYVDFKVGTVSDENFEFTNIERDELPSLQMYIKGYLEVKAKQAQIKAEALTATASSSNHQIDLTSSSTLAVSGKGPIGSGGSAGGMIDAYFQEEEDSEDEDDEDFDPDAPSDDDDDGSSHSDNDDESDDDDDDDDDGDEKHNHKKKASSSSTSSKKDKQIKRMVSVVTNKVSKASTINSKKSKFNHDTKEGIITIKKSSSSSSPPSSSSSSSSSGGMKAVSVVGGGSNINPDQLKKFNQGFSSGAVHFDFSQKLKNDDDDDCDDDDGVRKNHDKDDDVIIIKKEKSSSSSPKIIEIDITEQKEIEEAHEDKKNDKPVIAVVKSAAVTPIKVAFIFLKKEKVYPSSSSSSKEHEIKENENPQKKVKLDTDTSGSSTCVSSSSTTASVTSGDGADKVMVLE